MLRQTKKKLNEIENVKVLNYENYLFQEFYNTYIEEWDTFSLKKKNFMHCFLFKALPKRGHAKFFRRELILAISVTECDLREN